MTYLGTAFIFFVAAVNGFIIGKALNQWWRNRVVESVADSMTREIEVDHGQCAECDPRVVRFADYDRQIDDDFGE